MLHTCYLTSYLTFRGLLRLEYSYRFRGKEESRVDPEENQHCLSSDYSFLGNSGLISSDGHGKANTTAGEEADKIRSMETISAGDGKLLPSLRG